MPRRHNRSRNPRGKVPLTPPAPPSTRISSSVTVGNPVFNEPSVTPDPLKFKEPHASDSAAYKEMDALIKAHKFQPLPFPVVPNVDEPVLTLAAALGSGGTATAAKIEKAGRIVFHSAGDTGATKGPNTENIVVNKLLSDFADEQPEDVPQFFYNLGDIVYSFGEHKYYYDQFYEAYRDYPAPIFAIPGNHDGIVLPPPSGTTVPSLSAFLANFCTEKFTHSSDSMGIARTTMIQPGVYFTLEAPFLRILGLYSNMLENPGVISNQSGRFPQLPDAQIKFLTAALSRIKKDNFEGAIIITVHHPPYAIGTHSGSMVMLKEIDAICKQTGVWPHAVLSGHAHSYQRFTRTIGGKQIPHIVCGNGGHGLQPVSRTQTLRTPASMQMFAQPEAKDQVTFESYDDKNYGYLRVLVDTKQLRIEYHPAPDGTDTKTPDDAVTVDLAARTLVHYNAP